VLGFGVHEGEKEGVGNHFGGEFFFFPWGRGRKVDGWTVSDLEEGRLWVCSSCWMSVLLFGLETKNQITNWSFSTKLTFL